MSAAGTLAAEPVLSIVVVTDDDGLETLAKTLGHLGEQTIADRIELVLVASRGADIDTGAAALAPFARTAVVRVDKVDSLSWAREPGVRAAGAPLVAFAENHTFHARDWAERLVEAHQGPWVAVGPGVANANPSYAASWANFLLDYGHWYLAKEPAEVEDLPGHNTCYKREVIQAYGPELKDLLEQETFLHADMRRRGGHLLMDTSARISHVNVTALRGWFSERVVAAQRFAGARSAGWPMPRRLLYAAGAPLVPLIRLIKTLPDLRLCARNERLPRWVLPALLSSLCAGALGEFLGYTVGGGDSMYRLSQIELYKHRHHLRAGDELAPVPLPPGSSSPPDRSARRSSYTASSSST